MMIGGKHIGGPRLGGKNQDGHGMTKSEDFFQSLRISHPRGGNYCVCDGIHVSPTVFAVPARSLPDPRSRLHSLRRTSPDPKARVKSTSARAARSLATWPIPRTPQVVSPKSSTRSLLQTERRRPSTIRTTIASLTSPKSARESTEQFGVPTMFETCVSHGSYGEFALQREIQESMPRETVAGQRERGKRRFCDQCCRVDVKEKSTEQY